MKILNINPLKDDNGSGSNENYFSLNDFMKKINGIRDNKGIINLWLKR